MAAYSATKAGLIGMVKSLAKDHVEQGITINALAPAVIRTPMVQALPQATIDYMTAKIPMRRWRTGRGGADDRVDRFAGLQLHQRLHIRSERGTCDLLNLERPLRTARGRLI